MPYYYTLDTYQATWSTANSTTALDDGSVGDTSTSVSTNNTGINHSLTLFFDNNSIGTISACQFTGYGQYYDGNPWILEGSSDTTTWTTITSGTVTYAGGNISASVSGLTGSYRYYRLSIQRNWNFGGPPQLLISDWRLTLVSNGATFVSQSGVPSTMTANSTVSVSVTMNNSGGTTWTYAGNYKLGSQNPQDNTNWGNLRIWLNVGESVAPAANRTFTFNITAPSTPGTYNFQWQMVQDGVEWFGAQSTNVVITVTASGRVKRNFMTGGFAHSSGGLI